MSDQSHDRKAQINARSISSHGISLIAKTLLLAAAAVAPTHSLALSHAGVSIATQLKEVQSGTIDGRSYLTLNIGGHKVGPSTCRSNILRMDTSGDAGAERQEEIEAIAITAMLSGATVMIDVPLDTGQCVDGKPTFTNLYRIVSSKI
ncbi:MAG: hypothetical protein AB8B64_09720 [Granulosicoccus sp.]